MNKGLKKLTKKERGIYLSVASVFFILLALLFTYFKPINTMDYMVSDFFYQSLVEKKERDLNIKIIAIDEKTVNKLGSFKTWERSEAARLINYLNNNGNKPDVIAFGLDFHDEKGSEGDIELINACREHKNVCISSTVETETKKAARAKKVRLVSMTSGLNNTEKEVSPEAYAYNPPNGTMGGEKITGVSTPFKALMPHIATGVINTAKNDDDGYVRNLVASVNYNGTHYESFSIMIYRMYLYYNGKNYDIPEANYENELGINYSKNGGNFKTYSYYDVITGKVDKKEFGNSVVFVGDYTEGNTFNVPNRRTSQINEIELQASILSALVQNNTIHYAHKWFLAIWYSLFAVLFFIATSHSSGPSMIFSSVVLIAGQVASSCVLNVWGYYIPLLRIIMLIITIALVNLVAGYIIIKRQRYSLEKVFKKYVDEQVVNEIKDGGIDVAIGGKRKNIAVLFVDIRGFTPLSENLMPEQVVDILNSYLTIIADAVADNGGTLDKFIGDAAMAVFNSPSDLDDYVFRAVCTAWDIVSNGAALRQECLQKYGVEVEFGIGVHCGDAVIGNIGSQSRMEYTAIGDTVNTASRLEGVAEPGQILITRAVARGAGNRIEISFAGQYSLKGKKKKIAAYEVNKLRERPEPLKREKSIEEKCADGIKEIKKVPEKYLANVQELKEGIKEGIKEAGNGKNGITEILTGKR
ncbi:MAG: adenylate/guanylate cyclase domain-containing protein [Lachnospiraceae bacterium]|nr:adenylate/guanylate cyclase domain-containing protein [Lachnospiraceae bacterium]